MDIESVVDIIRDVVQDIKMENNINGIIKDGIFEVLEKKCTVIYYPINDRKNRGFHIKKLVKNELQDFVYINTAKTVEQQIFTAAHEMGHVFKVGQRFLEKLSGSGVEVTEFSNDDEEKVVDRFAAELLMPFDMFEKSVQEYIDANGFEEVLSVIDLLKMIAKLMGEYMSPFNAVRKRLVELGFFDKAADDYLRKNKIMLEAIVDQMKKDDNSILSSGTNVKMISGLRDIVVTAEGMPGVNQGLVLKLKRDFELDDIELKDTIVFKLPKE